MLIRRVAMILPAILSAFVAVNSASAVGNIVQEFKPVDATGAGDNNKNDLEDLDHHYAYRWAINYTMPAGYDLVSAKISFDNIRNWDTNANRLYLRLLDTTSSHTLGVRKYEDNPNDNYFSDYFANFSGTDMALHTYVNLGTTAQDLTYTLDAAELAALASYAADGYFGFGFDPDCHYYNDGIKLVLCFEPTPPGGGDDEPGVPEPVTATLGMMSAGGLLLATSRRRKA